MARMSADERRELLLDAAIRVMTAHGVAAGTTRTIVAEAGMAVSVFHYCFRSRDELLAEVMRRLSAVETQAVWDAMEPGRSLRETLTMATDGYLAHLSANPGHELVLFELNHHAQRTNALRGLAAEQYATYARAAESVLARAAELAGVVWTQDLPVLARLAVTMLDGITTTWLADRNTAATRQVLTVLVAELAGFAVTPATARRRAAHRTDRTR